MLCLQTDVKLNKEKVKRKHAIIMRQEEELTQRESSLEKAMKAEQTATARSDHLQKELKAAEEAAGELRAKLDDARQQLQSNEQMIRWLNQQVRLATAACWLVDC
jgi:spindle assembly abnormal protein 6